MKKFALLILNENFESKQIQMNVPNIEHHIICVRSIEEAFEKVIQLVNSGFGAIELCGAFGKEIVTQLYELCNCTVPIGYVIYPPEQLEKLTAFWDMEDGRK